MIHRLRRLLWRIEDNAKGIVLAVVGSLLVGAVWLGAAYLLFAGEFK